jgi:heat shock protein HslJ
MLLVVFFGFISITRDPAAIFTGRRPWRTGKKSGDIPGKRHIFLMGKISADFIEVKGFIITCWIPSVSMEPVKKTRKIPFLPLLVGLMILIPLIIAAGCTGKPPVSSDLRLNGTRWVLTDYVSYGTSRQALDGTTVTLEFSNDGRIAGSAGCNHYFAVYGMKSTAITIGPAGSTEMYCSATGVMDQESAYLALLQKASLVTAGNDRLAFADANGTTILSFTRIFPPAPEPLVGTNWTLDSVYSGDAVSSVIAGTTITAVFGEDGSVAGSAGCNHYFASYNVTGPTMSIGPAGSTKMYCTGPGVMQQESSFLASLSRAASFTITGNRLSLTDANSTTLLSFTKAA